MKLETYIEVHTDRKLGRCEIAGGSQVWPPCHYWVEMPSGVRHYFESETAARASAYWPYRMEG